MNARNVLLVLSLLALSTPQLEASNPAEVLVFRFKASKKRAYSATVKLSDAHRAQIAAKDNRITSRGNLDG